MQEKMLTDETKDTKQGESVDSMRDLSAAEMMAHYEDTIKIFDDGDIVEGKVVKVDKDEILVDIGYKSEGVIPIRELSIRSDIKPEEVVSVGDSIEALVLQKEDKDGRLILSKKRAEYERSWGRIEKIFQDEGTVAGTVIEVVKGGLILDIGLRGFLPASLVDLRRVKDLEQHVGRELECKVIEMDRNRNNVVLSRRAVLEQERREERHGILSRLEKGQVLPGSISSIVDFGAFVDLGGIDGLIHISELSWTHVGHPSEVVSVGEQVQVQVLDVDQERERISLGLKQTREDPWKELVRDFPEGNIVEGMVTKLVPFGAFVQLTEGVEGLCHISELAEQHVELPEEIVRVGDKIMAKVMDVDMDRRRISLSLRQAAAEHAETGESEDTGEETGEEAVSEAQSEVVAESEEAAETEQPDEVETTAEPVAEAVEEPIAEEPTGEETVATAEAEDVPESEQPSEAEEPVAAEADVEQATAEAEVVEEQVASEESPAKATAESQEAPPEAEAASTEEAEQVSAPEEAAEGEEAEPEPGSLEDVVAQMKKSRSKSS